MKTPKNVADLILDEKQRMREKKKQAWADYLRPRVCFCGIIGSLMVIGSLVIVRVDWKVVLP